MFLHRIGGAILVGCIAVSAVARADEAVLLRYKFVKGDSQPYRSTQQLKQTQAFSADAKIETTMTHETVATRTVEAVTDGKATIKNKAARLKVTVEIGPLGKFQYDSQATERDTG